MNRSTGELLAIKQVALLESDSDEQKERVTELQREIATLKHVRHMFRLLRGGRGAR